MTRAVAEVLVSEIVRVGDPTRDELQRTPEECSGAGYRDAEDELGTGDPEACVCDPGFEGDQCEIHPCGYRGTLVFLDPQTGEKTCECVDKFSGDVCDVECNGNGKYDEDSGECECGKGWTGILCDAKCDGCDGEFGVCSLTAFSASTWQPDTQEYLLVDTVCSCVDDYMGANCTIPCPCAKGGFGKGTCAVDLVKLESGEYPDDELGVCICQDGYVGADCTIPCPACVSGQGTCQPPVGYEAGVGTTLLDLAATYAGSTLAAKVFEAPSTARARATPPSRTSSAGLDTPATTARCRAGRATWASARWTERAGVFPDTPGGGARTSATATGSSSSPSSTKPTPARILITSRWSRATRITTPAGCSTCTSSTACRRRRRTTPRRIARAGTGETPIPTRLSRFPSPSCRLTPKTVRDTPARSATSRAIRACRPTVSASTTARGACATASGTRPTPRGRRVSFCPRGRRGSATSARRAFIRASRASTGRARPSPGRTGSACARRVSPIPRV